MTEYVLGFAFNKQGDQVILIRKTKPKWQAGRLNGVGGKIEAGETPEDAMVREFREETGIETSPLNWVYRVVMQSANVGGCNSPLDPTGYRVHTFAAVLFDEQWVRLCSATEERTGYYQVDRLPSNCIQSVKWLVPFLLDTEMTTGPHVVPYIK